MVPFMHVDIPLYIGNGRSILDITPPLSNMSWSFRSQKKIWHQEIYISSTHDYVVSYASYISQLPQKLNEEDIHQTSQYNKMLIDFIEGRPSSPVNIHSLKLHHYPTKERKIQKVINTFQAFTLYTHAYQE